MLILRNELDKNGYVILRDFINPSEIHYLKKEAEEIFTNQFEHFGYPVFQGYKEDEIFKNNMIRLFNEHEEVFKNCGKLIQTGLVPLYELSVNPKILDGIQVLGVESPLMCTRPVLYFNHPKLAKSEEYYKSPLHQDWPSMEASMNSLVVWVPLVDVNKDNGSIIIYPGSHKKGVLPFKSVGGFANVEYEGTSIQPELNVGDICIFSTLLVHKSGDILDDSIRWSCHFRFTDMLCPDFIQRGYPSPYSYTPITKTQK